MPSLASGKCCCTAWAMTCAVEWRSTASPSSEETSTPSTTSPSASTWDRSRSSPLTRATTTSRSSVNSSAAVVPAVTCCVSWPPAPDRVMDSWADTVGLRGWRGWTPGLYPGGPEPSSTTTSTTSPTRSAPGVHDPREDPAAVPRDPHDLQQGRPDPQHGPGASGASRSRTRFAREVSPAAGSARWARVTTWTASTCRAPPGTGARWAPSTRGRWRGPARRGRARGASGTPRAAARAAGGRAWRRAPRRPRRRRRGTGRRRGRRDRRRPCAGTVPRRTSRGRGGSRAGRR